MFLFFAFALNTQDNQHVFDDNTDYVLRSGTFMVNIACIIFFIVNLWIVSALPLHKNILLVKALQAEPGQVTTAEESQQVTVAFKLYQEALEAKSPVGQEEAIGMFTKFAVRLVETVKFGSVDDVKLIVNMANDWYDRYSHVMVGAKDAYINGGLNLRAGVTYDIPEFSERGYKIYDEVLANAPTRMEFLQILYQVARMTSDAEKVKQLGERMNALRPDLGWPTTL